jgi:hypothetical protein
LPPPIAVAEHSPAHVNTALFTSSSGKRCLLGVMICRSATLWLKADVPPIADELVQRHERSKTANRGRGRASRARPSPQSV